MAITIQRYVQKKHGDTVKFLGTKEEFAEIDLDGTEFESSKGPRMGYRTVDMLEAQAIIDRIQKLAKEKEQIHSSMRSWMVKEDLVGGIMVDMFLEWVPTMVNHPLRQSTLTTTMRIDKSVARKLFHVMLKDNWVDTKNRVTQHGIDEAKQCLDMRRVLS